jgi:Secretion system C-terminal sorting domain
VPCVVKTTATKETLLNENTFSIFPNPNNGILNLQLSENVQFSDVQHISIFDLKGTLMYKNASFIEKIDLKNAPKGVYVVKIQCANGLFVKKVVLEN